MPTRPYTTVCSSIRPSVHPSHPSIHPSIHPSFPSIFSLVAHSHFAKQSSFPFITSSMALFLFYLSALPSSLYVSLFFSPKPFDSNWFLSSTPLFSFFPSILAPCVSIFFDFIDDLHSLRITSRLSFLSLSLFLLLSYHWTRVFSCFSTVTLKGQIPRKGRSWKSGPFSTKESSRQSPKHFGSNQIDACSLVRSLARSHTLYYTMNRR